MGLNSTGINLNSREAANPPQLIVADGRGFGRPDSAEERRLGGRSIASPRRQHTSITSADTDGDGLPDLWEIESGTRPTSAVGADGAAGDPDNDGATNLQEYQAGTDSLDFSNHP
jgi:hypothetical protein